MVGIVVVSHSRALGEAVASLAREMAGGADAQLSLAVAAGLDEETFGTDAAAVAGAIEEVAAADNDVLVLVDIGSSVLSAEMAREFIDPELAERVRISAGPLVEGIVPAVVAAAAGASLDEVAAEAEEGLDAKREHLGADPGLDAPSPLGSCGTRPASVEIVLTDPHGLHARPAAKLVSLVRSYDATVTLTDPDANAGPVPATSLSKVATLNAGHGARLRVAADGPQAAEVLAAVSALAARDFQDDVASPDEASTAVATDQSFTRGSGIDVALGPAHVLRREVDLDDYHRGSASEEQRRSDAAVAAVADAIRRQQHSDPTAADILGAHLGLLEDGDLLAAVADRIGREDSAPDAWGAVLRDLAADFEGLSDAYQRARAQDVRAVGHQLLVALAAGTEALATAADSIPGGAVLVVDELDPATASSLDAGAVAGIVTARGGNTGHGVIVARSRGIPMYTDGGDAAATVDDGMIVGFDATARLLVVDPDPEATKKLRHQIDRRTAEAADAQRRATDPAITGDGVRVRVGVNIASVGDALVAGAGGAEGSGLVRTELIFGAETTAPSAGRQGATFLSIASGLRWKPITIRTWDVGGDKPLPFLPGPREANPMLGVRGLRLMRQHPELLDDQLIGVCAAAEQTPVRVMFPMVTTREEVDWALGRLERARAASDPVDLEVGIMVEVPAAALRIAELAAGLDFVSIGTNDLAQYTLATDRGNAALHELSDVLDPAVLQLIRQVVDNVPAGVDVGVCGDLASRAEAVPLLVGLGIRELSVIEPMIPLVKQAVRHTSVDTAQAIVRRALEAPSAQAVRELLAEPR